MKKIMFNDKYVLTKAVLDGRKTQTRRIITTDTYNRIDWKAFEEGNYDCVITDYAFDITDIRYLSKYKVGEEVAVAQRYLDFRKTNGDVTDEFYKLCSENYMPLECLSSHAGAKNKMFVDPKLMPHRIHITNIRVERLQDISDEDCLKEGIQKTGFSNRLYQHFIAGIKRKGNTLLYLGNNGRYIPFKWQTYETPREAFAALIDKTCGNGTWHSNPFVFVYDFELVK